MPTHHNKEEINKSAIIARLFLLVCLSLWNGADAAEPRISIIIDDMGYSRDRGVEALALQQEITYSFLPFAPYTTQLHEMAWKQGKESMLHLPMQSQNGEVLDQGGLRMEMARKEFYKTLLASLDAVPHAVGVNNHMGSLLTRHPGMMKWLMVGLKSYGELFFVDSRTCEESVAARIAIEKGILAGSRDVFLDHDRSETAIEQQLDHLITIAKKHGTAIGIGHPYTETLRVLAKRIPGLKPLGINLVKTSTLLTGQERRELQWHASLSPLPKVVKNSRQSQ